MKNLLLWTILLMLAIAAPATAQVNVNIGVALPPIGLAAPPEVIPLPDTTDVYVVPDVTVDLFFYNGWWWRPWQGRWYRSHYYDRGWVYFNHVPHFYAQVDPNWRTYYSGHNWHGHPWNYARIPNQRLQQNWRGWHNTGHWRKQGAWGVQGYRPRPRQQRPAQGRPGQRPGGPGRNQPGQHQQRQPRGGQGKPQKPQGKPERKEGGKPEGEERR